MPRENEDTEQEWGQTKLCVLLEKSVTAEQNLNGGRQQQVTCILNQILNVNLYH